MSRRRAPTTNQQPDVPVSASGAARGGKRQYTEGHGVAKKKQPARAKTHNDALHLQTIDKREEALALRGRGMSYEAIGRNLKVSTSVAYDYVQNALNERKERLSESAEQLRQMMHARLDAQYEKLVGKFEKSSVLTIASISNALVKIEERRAKLDGLDLPIKQDVSGALTIRIVNDSDTDDDQHG